MVLISKISSEMSELFSLGIHRLFLRIVRDKIPLGLKQAIRICSEHSVGFNSRLSIRKINITTVRFHFHGKYLRIVEDISLNGQQTYFLSFSDNKFLLGVYADAVGTSDIIIPRVTTSLYFTINTKIQTYLYLSLTLLLIFFPLLHPNTSITYFNYFFPNLYLSADLISYSCMTSNRVSFKCITILSLYNTNFYLRSSFAYISK